MNEPRYSEGEMNEADEWVIAHTSEHGTLSHLHDPTSDNVTHGCTIT